MNQDFRSFFDLTKDGSVFIKAFAILFVMFVHFLPPFLPCSELLIPFKRFVGQVGVNLFLLISGYGVSKSYFLKREKKPTQFIVTRMAKLWPIYILVMVFYSFFQVFLFNENISVSSYVVHLLCLQTYLGLEVDIYWTSYFMSAIITVYLASFFVLFYRDPIKRIFSLFLLVFFLQLALLVFFGKFFFVDLFISFLAGVFISFYKYNKAKWVLLILCGFNMSFLFMDYYRLSIFLSTICFFFLFINFQSLFEKGKVSILLTWLGANSYALFLSHNYFAWKWPEILGLTGSKAETGLIIIICTLFWIWIVILLNKFVDGLKFSDKLRKRI